MLTPSVCCMNAMRSLLTTTILMTLIQQTLQCNHFLGNSVLHGRQQDFKYLSMLQNGNVSAFVSHHHDFWFNGHTLQIMLGHVARMAYCDAFYFFFFILAISCSTICSKISEKASKLSVYTEMHFMIIHPFLLINLFFVFG